MIHRLVLPFARPPMSSNAQRRAHWTRVREAKNDVQQAVWALAKQQKLPRVQECVVILLWTPPDRITRDSDSLSVMAKAALDGLVQAGVIRDDSSAYVRGTFLAVLEPQRPGRIELLVDDEPDRWVRLWAGAA